MKFVVLAIALFLIPLKSQADCTRSNGGRCLEVDDLVVRPGAGVLESGRVSRIVGHDQVEVEWEMSRTFTVATSASLYAEKLESCAQVGLRKFCFGDDIAYFEAGDVLTTRITHVYEGNYVRVMEHVSIYSVVRRPSKILALTPYVLKALKCNEGICVGDPVGFKTVLMDLPSTGPVRLITDLGICYFTRYHLLSGRQEPYTRACKLLYKDSKSAQP